VSSAFERLPASRFLLGLLAVLLLHAAAATTAKAEITSTSQCADEALSKHFLSYGDDKWYSQVPGQGPNGFDGAGWTLSGGAGIASSSVNGQTVQVLDLPSGSKAISPTVCVTKDFPTARMMVRNVVGAEGVFFYVSYAGTDTWTKPKNTGQVHGKSTAWTLSDPVNLQPNGVKGWALVRFTLIPGGTKSRFQIYDFWTDPFSRR
jgi:hypothetical protein